MDHPCFYDGLATYSLAHHYQNQCNFTPREEFTMTNANIQVPNVSVCHGWFLHSTTGTDEIMREERDSGPWRQQIRYTDSIYLMIYVIVRRAGLLWSQQDFEWRWSVPLFKCLTVLEFSFILFDLCLLITFFNFIMNYVPIVTFWMFTYHKIWILSIMFCFIWSYWIIYFLACLEVSWRVVS